MTDSVFISGFHKLRPLTRAVAEDMGHVAWIEEQDPVRAISKMYNAVAKEGYNCAVWADAGKQWREEDKKAIKAWRADIQDSISDIFDKAAVKDSQKRLTNTFIKARMRVSNDSPHYGTYDILRDHMHARIQQIASVITAQTYKCWLRAHDQQFIGAHAHVDGDAYGQLRFIESIESPGTCLIANKDVRISPHLLAGRVQQNSQYFRLKRSEPVTFWQLPENSLCLMTNKTFNGQPIMHSVPPTPEGEEEPKRNVFLFDISN